MNNFIKNSFNLVKSRIQKPDKKFFPCPRQPCYCKIVVNYPQHTIITSELISNVNKCGREYYMIQKYVNRENPREE